MSPRWTRPVGVAVITAGSVLGVVGLFWRSNSRPRLYLLVQPPPAAEAIRADFQARGLPLKSGWDARIYGYGRGGAAPPPDTGQITLIVVAVSLAVRFGGRIVDRGADKVADTFLDAVGKIWEPLGHALSGLSTSSKSDSPEIHLLVELANGQQVRAVFPEGADLAEALRALGPERLPAPTDDRDLQILQWDSEKKRWALLL